MKLPTHPRDFVFVVGGGAGPAHAGMLASELGIRTVLIPKVSSAFCAFGEIISDMKHNYLSSYTSRLDRLDHARLNGLFAEMEARGRQELAEAGATTDQIAVHRSLDMRYVDQIHECQVDIPATDLTPQSIGRIAEAFHRRHEELFTYSERDNMVEIINLESTVTGQVVRPQLPILEQGTADSNHARTGERRAFFEETGGFVATPIYDGAKLLVGNRVPGPAIIEEETTTIVIFPGWQADLVNSGTYVMIPTR